MEEEEKKVDDLIVEETPILTEETPTLVTETPNLEEETCCGDCSSCSHAEEEGMVPEQKEECECGDDCKCK